MKLLLPSVTKTPSAWSGRAGRCQPEQLPQPGQLLQLDLEQLLAATDGDPLRLPQLLPRQP